MPQQRVETTTFWQNPLVATLARAASVDALTLWDEFYAGVVGHDGSDVNERELSDALEAAEEARTSLLLARARLYLGSSSKQQRALGDLSEVISKGSAEEQCEAWLLKACWARRRGDLLTQREALEKAREIAVVSSGVASKGQKNIDAAREVMATSSQMEPTEPPSRLPHKPEGGDKPKQHSGGQQVVHDLDLQAAVNIVLQANDSELRGCLAAIPAHLQDTLAELTAAVVEERRRIRVLGIDLQGLDRHEAIRSMNRWLRESVGGFADAENELKEEVVECLRGITSDLRAEFLLASGGKEGHQSVTLRCGTNQYGNRRFTVSESGGRRKTLTQLAGLPELSLRPLD